MPGQRKLNLTVQPPVAGMVRRTGFQGHPPFSSYDTSNFWPIDVDTGRAVTSTRPALGLLSSPGQTVNLLAPINGKATGKPFQSIIAASDVTGQLFWWDGIVWRKATGAAAASVDTGRAVYATPFLQHAYIAVEDSKPIDFNYVLGTATVMDDIYGNAPDDCRIAFTHEGCLCLAGRLDTPHILFMSRTGDAYDWDYLADIDDEGGAFTTAGENEGLLNGPITAGFNFTNDTSIVSTMEGLMALRGHPRRGGVFERMTGTYVLGQGAWCKTPNGVVFFMTKLGLMMLDPSHGATPAMVSQRLIPDELIGLPYDYEDPAIAMAYSTRWNGVYISDRTSGSEQAWLYHLPTGGFHRQPVDDYPYVMFEFEPELDDDRCGVLWGKS